MAKTSRPAHSLLPHLGERLAYPLQPSLLWLFGALCLLRLLSHLPNLLGLLFELSFWVMAFKLAVEALNNTAHGRYEAVSGGDLLATDGDGLRQLLLQLALGVAMAATLHWFGPVALGVLSLLAVVFMPAAIILLAINGSVGAAINPLAWGALIGRLGAAYFGVVVVLAVLQGVGLALLLLFDTVLPAGMDQLPGSLVVLYLLVAGFHLLGDLVHRHHEMLGLDIAPAVPRATHANPFEDEAMAHAETLAREGRPADAATHLQDLFRGRGASDPVHDRYRELLLTAGDIARLAEHDRGYLPSLLATGKEKRALAVLLEIRRHQPGFLPSQAEDLSRLVLLAARAGRSQDAVTLGEEFLRQFPAALEAPSVVLAIAPLMADRLGREEDAARHLKQVLPRHRDHALAASLHEALAELERTRVRGAG